MTELRTVTWEHLLEPETPLTVLAEVRRRGLDAAQWADEVWRTGTVHDATRFGGVAYDDFVALVERELLFAAHG